MSTTSQKTEFSNSHVKVSFKRLPGCLVDMEITVTPEASQAAYSKAIKEVRKEISIPGFRRGKIPESMVLQKFKPDVENEWKKIIINTSITEAVQITHLQPTVDSNKQPRVKLLTVPSLSKESDSIVHVQFEVIPETPVIDINQISPHTAQKTAINQNDFEERFHELLLSKATWEKIEGKEIQERDFVDLLTEDEKEPVRLWVRKDTMPEKLYNNLIGRKAGDSFLNEADQSEEDETPSGNVTVVSVLQPILPEANDEFAKQFGAQSIDDLKFKIKLKMQSECDKKYYEESSNQIIQQLLSLTPIDIPESQILEQIKIVTRQVDRNLEFSATQTTQAQRKKALDEIKPVIEKRAREIIQLRYIAIHLAQNHQLNVTNEEYHHELTQLAELVNHGLYPLIQPTDDVEEIRTEVYYQLLTQKVLNFLIDQLEKR